MMKSLPRHPDNSRDLVWFSGWCDMLKDSDMQSRHVLAIKER